MGQNGYINAKELLCIIRKKAINLIKIAKELGLIFRKYMYFKIMHEKLPILINSQSIFR